MWMALTFRVFFLYVLACCCDIILYASTLFLFT